MRRLIKLLAVSVVVFGCGGMTPVAADPTVALHKAIYQLKMDSVSSGSGIVGIDGKMYFETDDACDAWTTDQRFTTEYQYPESRAVLNTNHYVSWESKDQKTFQFSSERQEDGEVVELLRGNAIRADDSSGKAEYTRPKAMTFSLPAGYFLPTAHTSEMIKKAKAGEKVFRAVMFDGTDADGPVEMTAVIGKKVTADEIKKIVDRAAPGKIDPALLSTDAWHVRIALFPLKEDQEMTPAYEMDMTLHDNGIVSAAVVDYKEFRVSQTLEALEKLPAKKCP